ncbi:MAG: DNA-directed RNA polymerase subunit omega [Ignavibacteria bacterium]|nr:DNA-directed RNA polymerase subunit omega [Ignavibacteria bacterium]
MAIKTLDIERFESKAHNVYEAVAIASQRAKQINDEEKMELNQRLEPIIAKEEEDDTIMNQDKLNISLEFEQKDKPTIRAVKEILNDDVNFRFKEKE